MDVDLDADTDVVFKDPALNAWLVPTSFSNTLTFFLGFPLGKTVTPRKNTDILSRFHLINNRDKSIDNSFNDYTKHDNY